MIIRIILGIIIGGLAGFALSYFTRSIGSS